MQMLPHYAPTRHAESLLAWLIIGWSLVMVGFDGSMTGRAYVFFAAVAPLHVLGSIGVLLGTARIVAIIINGRWRRTPLIRLIGAASGLMWWTAVTVLFWVAVVRDGLMPFPMLGGYPVLIMFEVVSCYRCGQDAYAMRSLSPAPPRSARASDDG